MKKNLVIISGIFLFLFFHERSFAQQVVNNKPVAADAIIFPADSSVKDTTQVLINTSKRTSDYYSVPVPVQVQAGKKEEPVIINQPRKIGTPH